MVQMGVALKHLNHVKAAIAPEAPLIFCGDFNSSPDSGEFASEGLATLVPALKI